MINACSEKLYTPYTWRVHKTMFRQDAYKDPRWQESGAWTGEQRLHHQPTL